MKLDTRLGSRLFLNMVPTLLRQKEKKQSSLQLNADKTKMTGLWRAARSSWSEAHFPRASLPEFRVAQEQFFFFVDFFDSYDGFRRRGGIVSSLTLASNTHKVYFLLSYYRYHLNPLAAVSAKTFS